MGRGGDLTIQPPSPPPRYNHDKPEQSVKPRVSPSFFREAWGMEIVLGICITIAGILFVIITPTVTYQTQTVVLGGGLMAFGILVIGVGVHKYRQPRGGQEYEEPSESDPLSSIISSTDSRQSSRRSRYESSGIPEHRLSIGPIPPIPERYQTEKNNLNAALIAHHRSSFIPQRVDKNNLSKDLKDCKRLVPQKNAEVNIGLTIATIEQQPRSSQPENKNNIAKAMAYEGQPRRSSKKRHSTRSTATEAGTAHDRDGRNRRRAHSEHDVIECYGSGLSEREREDISSAMMEYYHSLLGQQAARTPGPSVHRSHRTKIPLKTNDLNK